MDTTTTQSAARASLAMVRLGAMAGTIQNLNADLHVCIQGRIEDIRAAADAGVSHAKIAEAAGVTRQRVHQIARS